MIEEKAAKIKLLILDVDGVLTDGRLIMNEHGEETKNFNVRDGLGLKTLQGAGIDVILISARTSRVVEHRAKDLGIEEIYQGIKDKGRLCIDLIQRKGLKRDQVCCVGDDLLDLSMLNQAGMAVAVADATDEVRDAADFVTKNKGGHGAVREVCEVILKAKKEWAKVVSFFAG